jgi:hypothetical protein
VSKQTIVCVNLYLPVLEIHTHTHTCTWVYIYICLYTYMCVCVRVCVFQTGRKNSTPCSFFNQKENWIVYTLERSSHGFQQMVKIDFDNKNEQILVF